MRKQCVYGASMLALVIGGLLAVDPAGAASSKNRVDRITCEEFLARSPEHRERIAYWVDGYRVAKGEEMVGTIGFDKFDRPVAALVEDCKATPHETLWQKLTKHM